MKRNEEDKSKRKNEEETSVHVSSSAVDSGSRTLSAIPATARVTSSSSPPPTQLANIILTGDLRSATNRSLEPSIAASMASFSAATSFVGAANGSVLTTSSASFNAQNSKITNNGGGATVQVGAHQQHIFHQSLAQQQVRHSLATASIPACSPPAPAQSTAQPSHQQQNIQAFPINAGQHGPGAQQFQRLKVEDALSYLDQVKYKFGNQPQVYNDFLDIMKEFKSQSIDTPGVIARVSSLFRGHPELIVGFNTFLPPGYKIEVQAEQVSVSVPGSMGVPAHIHHITHGPVPPTSSTITQQLEVVARSTPPVQHVSVTAATAAPQLQQQSSLPASSGAPPISAVSQQTTTVKEEIPLAPAGGALTVKPAVSSPIAHAASVSSGGPSFGLGSLHKESASSPQLGSAAHGYANSSSQGAAAAFGVPNASQPVEFNHAINYVNKIKNRFQGQPDIYKQFLEILHTYQKEQRSLKEGLVNPINYRPTLTEAEVYAKVAQLFQNQEDLLQEFGQFLPDATNVSRSGSSITSCGGVGASGGSGGGGNGGSGLLPVSVPNSSSVPSKKSNPVTENTSVKSTPVAPANSGSGSGSTGTGQTGLSASAKVPLKRAAPATSAVLPSSSPSGGSLGMGGSNQGSSIIPNKKPRLNSSKDYSIADVGKYGTMNELAFFDKVRRVACRSREVYDNFLRCLVMYNQEIISKMELLQITTPFLSRHPDLLKWFKDFLGLKETNMETHVDAQPISLFRSRIEREMLTSKDGKDSRDREREALEIDYSTCKRLGTSYCALPKSYEAPKCSGRTPLCKEVLNETWVSFPSWSSEDSTFVSSRKTQYEEYIYRTEDERYELDIVLETHMSTIRVLEGVMKKLNRMNPDEAARFKLDDCLGGSSPTIHIRAIRRIYGDKASEIIEGLKRSPMVAIPVVLRRMKAKEEEWREAQKGFNKIWRDQNEKYYLKSLDHLGTNFKQNDVKALRSKALINEIETICEERNEENAQGKNDRSPTDSASGGPHMKFVYKSRHKVLDDAADLLIHHAKRQTNITKEDKRRIKTLLRQTIPDMFRHPRQELSEDEREDDDDDDAGNKKETGKSSETTSTPAAEDGRKSQRRSGKLVINGRGGDGGESREGNSTAGDDEDEEYSVFFANNLWYVFLRLHHILCERLSKVWDRANQLLEEEKEEAAKTQRHSRVNGRSNENVAVALRLKPKAEVEVDQYYPHFLSMVKNLLDGNVEASSYEDSLREMFGIHAYLVFTLDKVIANAVRQLGHLVADDVCIQCTDIFLEEHGLKFSGHKLKGHDDRSENDPSSKKSSVGGDMSYQRRMEQILTEENLYRIVLWHKEEECTVTVELMDTDTHSSCSGENPPIQDVQNWSNYVERYVSDRVDEGSEKARRKNDPGGGGLKVKKPVFLQRNLKQWERRRRKDVGSSGGSDVKMDVDMKDVAAREDAHCVFNVNSYQMVFVANSESFLYKRHAFTRAKQCHRSVTLRMRKHFLAWQQQWASTNVTTEAESQCFNWLLGKGDNLELKTNSKTVRVPTNVEHRAPFGTLVKYRVEYDS